MPDGRFALIIATARYSDPTLTALEAPALDAESLAEVLAAPNIGGFDVSTLVDETAPKAMQEIESFFDSRRRDDLVLLYFSGHGILDEGARLYFATTDTRVDRPRSTAVAAGFVSELMNESRSRRQVLVLDCCNSGAFARGIKAGGSIGTGERFEGRGRVVITASDALQYAFEGGRVEGQGVRSVFTHVLVDGLKTGAADLDGDGLIALDELYDYVYGRVLDESPRQRPRKWAFDVEGQIFLARTESARDKPLAPPTAEPQTTQTAAARPSRLRMLRSKRLAAAGAAVAAAVVAALAVVALVNRSSSGSPPASPSSLAAGRRATLTVYEAWQSNKLDTLSPRIISASAKRALSKMPTEPITPVPPAPDECYGDPDDVGCTYLYPGANIHLTFTALRYGSGIRVADVRCYDSTTGNELKGGIATCARIVANS